MRVWHDLLKCSQCLAKWESLDPPQIVIEATVPVMSLFWCNPNFSFVIHCPVRVSLAFLEAGQSCHSATDSLPVSTLSREPSQHCQTWRLESAERMQQTRLSQSGSARVHRLTHRRH